MFFLDFTLDILPEQIALKHVQTGFGSILFVYGKSCLHSAHRSSQMPDPLDWQLFFSGKKH